MLKKLKHYFKIHSIYLCTIYTVYHASESFTD